MKWILWLVFDDMPQHKRSSSIAPVHQGIQTRFLAGVRTCVNQIDMFRQEDTVDNRGLSRRNLLVSAEMCVADNRNAIAGIIETRLIDRPQDKCPAQAFRIDCRIAKFGRVELVVEQTKFIIRAFETLVDEGVDCRRYGNPVTREPIRFCVRIHKK